MYQVKDIRTYIMGVSILSIMLFHTEGFFIVPKWIEFIQRTGFLGVDIFFFVSAYGLCYSMKKKTSLRLWYIKRFKRIVPAFLLAIIFYKAVFLIFDEKDNSLNISALIDSFLHYLVVFWYIPALLLFYLVFPLFFLYALLCFLYELSALSLCILPFFFIHSLFFLYLNVPIKKFLASKY